MEPGPGRVGVRLARTAGLAAVLASLAAGVLGGVSAGAAVIGVAAAVTWWARVTWWPSVQAWDALAEASDALRRGEAVDLSSLAGPSARVGHALDALRGRVEEAEQASSALQDRLAAVFEATPTGVAVIGDDGRVVQANQRLVDMLELTRRPEGRLPVEALRSPTVLEVVDAGSRGQTVEERPFATGERDLAASAFPMTGGLLLLVRDVTRARMAERARTDFVTNVSHELRTPIAALLGYSEALLDEASGLPEDTARMVRVVERHGRRLHRLFEDLLTLHKLEARRKEFPRDALSLDGLVAEACAVAADAAASAGLVFTVDVPEGLTGWGNRQAVSTIVGNLASNAVKYTPDGGSVTVRAERDDAEVRIAVHDTGPGIPAAAQHRVFERFFRVDEGRSRDVGGTGLGLAIVKHLAEASRARVSLTSEEGEGSTFTLHLPEPADRRVSRHWDETLAAPPASH